MCERVHKDGFDPVPLAARLARLLDEHALKLITKDRFTLLCKVLFESDVARVTNAKSAMTGALYSALSSNEALREDLAGGAPINATRQEKESFLRQLDVQDENLRQLGEAVETLGHEEAVAFFNAIVAAFEEPRNSIERCEKLYDAIQAQVRTKRPKIQQSSNSDAV
jgi:hypothetical protein